MSFEFDIIRSLIEQQQIQDKLVTVPAGDDAAVIQIPEGQELVVSMDTLVSDIHFFSDIPAEYIAHKALAVNLSDMAAMTAKPRWITLALTLPEKNTDWLAAFSKGFYAIAERFGVILIGGDLTRGPLSITVQAHGLVPSGQARLRSGAKAGDAIYVTNTLGEAALGLQSIRQGSTDSEYEYYRQRLHMPEPRVELALNLRPHINSMIDLSDGLAGDLNHICEASGLGAEVVIESLPVVDDPMGHHSSAQCVHLALFGGDDYELCFTADADSASAIAAIAEASNNVITRIGTMSQERGIRYWNQRAEPVSLSGSAFQHF